MSLQQEEATPLSFDDLKKMAGTDVKNINFILYENLIDISLQDFTSKPCTILLMQRKKDNVKIGHFIAILMFPHSIEHFDPYGLSTKKELEITGEKNILQILYKKIGKTVIENDFEFQQWKDNVETCGRWCIARCRMRDKNLNEFKKFFETKIHSMDDKVTLLTYLDSL